MLVELQTFDDALRDLRALEQQLATLERDNAAGLKIFDQMLGDQASRIADTQSFIAEKEFEIRGIEDDAKRSRGRMGQITSQRELTAVNKELDTQRRLNQVRGEELAKLKGELADVQADHGQKQAERTSLAQQMTEVEAKLRGDIDTRRVTAIEMQGKRTTMRTSMSREYLSKYDRVAKARNGLAVADVPGGNCAACNLAVPPHQLQKVIRGETLETCQSCQRLLVSYDLFRPPADRGAAESA
jgi:hypothetical protein